MPSKSIHVAANGKHFLWLSSSPLHVCVCVCVCVCVSMIIHSSVDGLLSCFHILTIVCNAAMSIYLFKLLGFFFFWIYAQEWNC